MAITYRSAQRLQRFQPGTIPFLLALATSSLTFLYHRALVKAFLKWLVTSSILLVSIPCLATLWITMVSYYTVIQRVLSRKYPNENLKVASVASVRTALDVQKNGAMLMLMLVFSGVPNMDFVLERMKEFLSLKKSSTWTHFLTTKLGCYVWKPCENFNLENHVTLSDGRWKGKQITDQNLQEYVSFLASQSVPQDLPPWKVLVVPYHKLYSSNSPSYAIVMRVHHLLVEGLSLYDIFQKESLPSRQTSRRTYFQNLPRPNFCSLAARLRSREFQESLFQLTLLTIKKIKWVIYLMSVVPSMIYSEYEHLFQKVFFSSIISETDKEVVVAWSKSHPQRTAQMIKKETFSSTNEILLSCLAGSMRKYFQATNGYVPKNIDVAFPVYSSNSAHSNLNEANPSGYQILSLPLDIADPLTRLGAIKEQIYNLRSASYSFVIRGLILRVLHECLPNFAVRSILQKITTRYPVIINNIGLTFCAQNSNLTKNSIEMAYYWNPPQSSIGLSLSFIHYNNSITLSTMSRRKALARPDVLVSYFDREFQELSLSLNLKSEERAEYCRSLL